jgi:hypothetical protein
LPDAPVGLSDHQALARVLTGHLEADSSWRSTVDAALSPGSGRLAHLAIFKKPYLDYVLAGRKTVESRFTRNLIPPHGVVTPGDLLLLKHASGPLVGLALVGFVRSYVLDPAAWREIRERFSRPMCAQDTEFWEQRRDARFATLMQICDRRRVPPVTVDKQDRRGWVVLRDHPHVDDEQLQLLEPAGVGVSGPISHFDRVNRPVSALQAGFAEPLQLSLLGPACA